GFGKSPLLRDRPGASLIRMRSRSACVLACVLLAAAACTAHADWPPGGIVLERVQAPGTNGFPAIGADGVGGTYVAWPQFDLDPGSVFRVHRLSPQGAPPVGWTTAGVLALAPNGSPLRPQLAPDGTGGTYVMWQMTDSTAFVGHIAANGTTAAGWPVDGLVVSTSGKLVDVVMTADGTGGVLLAWSRVLNGAPFDIVTQRFLSNGTRAPGFPAAGRVVTSFEFQRGRFHPQLVRDADRGFWLSFHQVEIDPGTPANAYAVIHLDP